MLKNHLHIVNYIQRDSLELSSVVDRSYSDNFQRISHTVIFSRSFVFVI